MLDGLYILEITSGRGRQGAGVALFERGFVRGGDGSYRYRGVYDQAGGRFTARLKLMRVLDTGGEVFGRHKQLTIELSGEFGNGVFTAQAGAADEPETVLTVSGRKVEDPPSG